MRLIVLTSRTNTAASLTQFCGYDIDNYVFFALELWLKQACGTNENDCFGIASKIIIVSWLLIDMESGIRCST